MPGSFGSRASARASANVTSGTPSSRPDASASCVMFANISLLFRAPRPLLTVIVPSLTVTVAVPST
jgi:hypothetical protein